MKKKIRLGTRGSPLALLQSESIKRRLIEKQPDLFVEIIPIRTSGDWRPEHKDKRFVEMGGNKGLFTKEIEDALESKHIDIAVHSMKDVPSTLPPQFDLGAILLREDARDAFIGRTAKTIDDLPQGATVGTSSLRRQAQLLACRSDLRIVPLRGNVETRLQKIEEGQADATLLAVAGMVRLGLEQRISSILPITRMLPAAAQGALGVEIRRDDADIRDILSALNEADACACVTAERAVMRAVDGTCNTPAGAYATLTSSGQIALEAFVARADGTDMLRLAATGNRENADQIGELLGQNLRKRSPDNLFAA